MVRPSERRDQVSFICKGYGISASRACKLSGLSRSVWYYQSYRDDSAVMKKLEDMATKLPQNGCKKWTDAIRSEGLLWNPKRIHRVYKLMKMNLRRKGKRRLPARVKLPLEVPESINESWSLDFVSDQLESGRRFRVLNVIDDHNREALAIEPSYSTPGWKLTQTVQEIIAWRGKPTSIRMDNGPEMRSESFVTFCKEQDIIMQYIQPGKPMQNGYIERFNGTYRKEILDAYLFESLYQVKEMSLEWLIHYNTYRPHDGLDGLTPESYLQKKGCGQWKTRSVSHKPTSQ